MMPDPTTPCDSTLTTRARPIHPTLSRQMHTSSSRLTCSVSRVFARNIMSIQRRPTAELGSLIVGRCIPLWLSTPDSFGDRPCNNSKDEARCLPLNIFSHTPLGGRVRRRMNGYCTSDTVINRTEALDFRALLPHSFDARALRLIWCVFSNPGNMLESHHWHIPDHIW